jgi:HEAT repeat protein
LVASRDKNIIFILRQALKAPDAHVRRLGCIGMGALGDGESIKDLGPMLTDSDPNVQLAAGLALGAIGTEAALETMLAGLIDGEQGLRQAVSEALAAIPGEGHAVLRDAMDSKDMQVRRAAVFGLARIKSAWAISLLYRALIEDEQWYVRNAAEQAFQRAERPEEVGVARHPEADALVWLVAWAAQRGEGVPAGPNARQVLIRVLQEGDPAVKAAAALTLANLGHVPALKPLYGALRDRDEKVRAAVYEALGDLQERLGQPLPAVM